MLTSACCLLQGTHQGGVGVLIGLRTRTRILREGSDEADTTVSLHASREDSRLLTAERPAV